MAPIRNSLSRLISASNVRFLLCLLVALSALTANAMPSPLLYNGEELQRVDDPTFSTYRVYYLSNSPATQIRTIQAKRDKKYDRNCFFSPVQCMLSYNANGNDVIYHPSGRR